MVSRMLYWANAIAEDGTGLFTYEGCLNLSEAISIFDGWNKCGYRIKEAWVSTYENGKETRVWQSIYTE